MLFLMLFRRPLLLLRLGTGLFMRRLMNFLPRLFMLGLMKFGARLLVLRLTDFRARLLVPDFRLRLDVLGLMNLGPRLFGPDFRARGFRRPFRAGEFGVRCRPLFGGARGFDPRRGDGGERAVICRLMLLRAGERPGGVVQSRHQARRRHVAMRGCRSRATGRARPIGHAGRAERGGGLEMRIRPRV
jgi:hypothetical protein